MTDALETRHLPGILQDIADLIGLPATLKLVEHYGGGRLYVPKRFDPDHPLVKIVGHANAARLVEAYGGEEHFDIPRNLASVLAARNARIRDDRAGGMSHRQLALHYQLTERQIRNVLVDEPEDDRQAGLF